MHVTLNSAGIEMYAVSFIDHMRARDEPCRRWMIRCVHVRDSEYPKGNLMKKTVKKVSVKTGVRAGLAGGGTPRPKPVC